MARANKTEIAQKRTLVIRPRVCRQAQRFQHFYVCFVASRALLFSTGTRVYAIFCRARLSLLATFVHQRGKQQWRRKQRSKRTLRLRPHFCRQAQRFQHFYVCCVASRALLFYTGTRVYAVFCRARLSLFVTFVHQRGEQQWRREQRSTRTLRLRPHFCRQALRFQQFSVALVCHFSLLLCTSAANNNGKAQHGENAHFGSEAHFCRQAQQFNIFLRAAFVLGRPKKGRCPDLAAEGFKNTLFVNEFLIGRATPPEPDFWTRLLDRCQKLQFRLRSVRIGADFC